MAGKIVKLIYNGAELEVDPSKSLDENRKFYAGMYPALTNATLVGPKTEGNVETWELKVSAGTKG